jgi:GDP/UDP-N,N'-diacetylbacillosamine 2-epimerase (hydrolysing)
MKIIFFSGSRSEYFLLKAVFNILACKLASYNRKFELSVVFGGVYSRKKDLKWREEEKVYLNSKNIQTIDVTSMVKDTQPVASIQIAKSIEAFENYLSHEQKSNSLLVVLGDRAETLGACISAASRLIPIAHLCGGESTIGAVDDWIRHSITKIASVHFPTSEIYRSRIIRMGEAPDLVFNFGHPIADMQKDIILLDRNDLDCMFPNIIDKSLVSVTVHPETANKNKLLAFEAIKNYIINKPELHFIVSGSNSDEGGSEINRLWECLSSKLRNMNFFDTLGSQLYLSFLSCSEYAIGNSSSLLIDTHITKTPAIVVGDRQDGRNFASGTVKSGYNDLEEKVVQLYRDKHAYAFDSDYVCFGACENIAKTILELSESVSTKKEFYDV